ncbi:hypothetical protein RQP53_12245 [Paucibacter sp. APW11]|uniref:Protein kinase domain-containing protein n=1 Tax=Roseateles aquae TaxID=3077235 RepID=A0ABU3PD61_9BURK|nr:hypothetical protein [Paucibacter sp. APW11]MDT9000037.1 hypothetical protein [Paucibacter sp. APW11]
MTEPDLPPPHLQPPALDVSVEPLAAGERLGVWRIVAPLQAVASGHWYRAEHALASDEQAAVLVYELPDDATTVLLRFADDHPGLAQLQHPDIALALDSGLTPRGQPYVVMQWLDGQPLLPAAMQLPLRKRLQLVLQLCELLQAVHEHGQVLRELDPGMLWLGPQQQMRLMAQGLAPMLPDGDAAEHGFSLAAQALISPELREGQHAHLASEAYAVGMLMCLLVNGRMPGMDAAIAAHIGAPVQSLAAWVSLRSSERLSLDAMLQKATAPDMLDRHVSVQVLADDIVAWLAGDTRVLPPTPEPVLQGLNPPPPPPPLPVAKESKQGFYLALAMAVLGLLAMMAWLVAQLLRVPEGEPVQSVTPPVAASAAPPALTPPPPASPGAKPSRAAQAAPRAASAPRPAPAPAASGAGLSPES